LIETTSPPDEQVLLDLLNSTPFVDGQCQDTLASDREAIEWARARGGNGSAGEAARLREARDRLQAVVRGTEPVTALEPVLHDVRLVPEVGSWGVGWVLDVAEDNYLAAKVVLEWGRLHKQIPGRLRPCANDECRLFLLDRSRANTARWCSMKVCGNRLKARRHQQRHRAGK
jgi:predicted RNA-binding Zn ribbon-like protein